MLKEQAKIITEKFVYCNSASVICTNCKYEESCPLDLSEDEEKDYYQYLLSMFD